MRCLVILILLVATSSCSNNKSTAPDASISGTWEIISFNRLEQIDSAAMLEAELHSHVSGIRDYQMAIAKGKKIEFTKKGKVDIDFIEDDYKSFMSISYKLDQNKKIADFAFRQDFGDSYNSILIPYSILNDTLRFTVSGILEVELKRINK